MSNKKTPKDEKELLSSVDAKLTAILSVLLRTNPNALEDARLANATTVGFLAKCGLEDEDIAMVLGTTKDSARVLRNRSDKGRK